MIYKTKQEAQAAADALNVKMDTYYKKWTPEKTDGGWIIVITYNNLTVKAKRGALPAILAGILIFITAKYF